MTKRYVDAHSKTHIFFLIRSLEIGGAERQLVALAKGMDKCRFNISVGIFYNRGPFRREIEEVPGVSLIPLGKTGRWDLLSFGLRLIRLLRELKPDILYSHMPEANLAGLVAGRLAGVPRIVWGIRASNMDVKLYNWLYGLSIRIGALLSRFTDSIIVNSFSGLSHHKAIGYRADHMVVVPNGIDTKYFKPKREARERVRAEQGINKGTTVIGLVGRLDPMKGHPTFLKAASIFIRKHGDVCFICVGNGPEPYKNKVLALGEKLGLKKGNNIVWMGIRGNMPEVYNAMDILTSSSSYGEGFPNVIGEAMACGIPCVVSDVGDSAMVVVETGIVVPHNDPEALAGGWQVMLQRLHDDPSSAGRKARARIISQFSSEKLVQRTSDALSGLL